MRLFLNEFTQHDNCFVCYLLLRLVKNRANHKNLREHYEKEVLRRILVCMIMVDEKEIEAHRKKWQDLLRLRDWDIQIKIVKTKWRKSGDIKIDLEDKKAILLINQVSKCENLEELVVHELLHLKLYGMDQMIEDLLSIVYGEKEKDPKKEFASTQFMVLLESTVEDLAKGYLAANRNQKALSFGRLEKAVGDEIGES